MSRRNNKRFSATIVSLFASNWFFWGVVAFVLFESIWIAFSSLYPMAFDEEYHLGLIRLYAAHGSPFWDSQPPGTSKFGSITTDPSFLYHLLVGYVYSALKSVITNETAQILILRAINIALFVAALPIWRMVLQKMGASRSLAHSVIAFFVLLPIVPLLAGQINYDNLLFLLVAIVSLLTIMTVTALKNQKSLPIKQLLLLGITALMAALTKYAFLPLLLVIAITLLRALWSKYSSFGSFYRDFVESFGAEFKKSRYITAIVVFVFLAVCILFLQRDIGNVVRYHTPAPSCDAVLSIEDCSQYGPWNRDYNLAKNKQHTNYNPIAFSYEWVRGMWHRSIFTLAGPTVNYQTRGPLTAPAYVTIFLGILVVAVILTRGWSVYKNGNFGLRFMVWMTFVYIAVLWLDGFEAYTRTGIAVAINGRYLLLILLPLGVFAGMCLQSILGKYRTTGSVTIASIAIAGMLWGGGLMTFIIRSNSTWYWPNHTVVTVNTTVQKWLVVVTPGSRKPTQFLP